jgi:hypothetical protein
MQDANLWKFCIFERRFGRETDGQTPGTRYSVKKVILIWVNLSENYVLKFASFECQNCSFGKKIPISLIDVSYEEQLSKSYHVDAISVLAFFQIASSAII